MSSDSTPRTADDILAVVERYKAKAGTPSAHDLLAAMASWFVGPDESWDDEAYGVWAERILAIEAEAAAPAASGRVDALRAALERLVAVADVAIAAHLDPWAQPKPNVLEAAEALKQARAVLAASPPLPDRSARREGLDVERLARAYHANRSGEFGANDCDCRERARQLLRSLPAGYRLARLASREDTE